jgi:epoxyqueuosine reductase
MQSVFENYPTEAIRTDRFLIDNEKCLSYLNESRRSFPEWLLKSVHHCVHDCLKCQIIYLMNKEHVENIVQPVQFTESETPGGIAKNLKVLIEMNNENEATL